MKKVMLAVLFLLAAGVARAESFTYTVSFVSLPVSSPIDMNMALSFSVPNLLGDSAVSIDLKDVTIEQQPIFVQLSQHADFTNSNQNQFTYGPSPLISLTASDDMIRAEFFNQVNNPHACLTSGCGQFFDGQWQRDDVYVEDFAAPVTRTGTFMPIHTDLIDRSLGNYPNGWTLSTFTDYESGAGNPNSLTIADGKALATPEPNSGLLVGAVALLTTLIVLWKRK